MSDSLCAFPRGRFGAVYADPPWSFATYSKTRQTRSAENHCAVMDLDAIKALPVASIAADDCACFMWSINSMLPQALDVMREWGFTYKTIAFTWPSARRPAPAGTWASAIGRDRIPSTACSACAARPSDGTGAFASSSSANAANTRASRIPLLARSRPLFPGPTSNCSPARRAPNGRAGQRNLPVQSAAAGGALVSDTITPEHRAHLDALGIGPNSATPAQPPRPQFDAPSATLFAPPPLPKPEEMNLTPLYPYQQTALDLVWEAIEAGETRIMIQLPTGGGKTVLAAHIFAHKSQHLKVSVFPVPLLSLIKQTYERFTQYGHRSLGVIQARHPLTNRNAAQQICSTQTFVARRKNGRRMLDDIGLVIVDEAHVKHGEIYQLMSEWPDVIFIGLSATPWAKALGKHWEKLIVCDDHRRTYCARQGESQIGTMRLRNLCARGNPRSCKG
jgi:hypothetical protein